MNAETSSSEFPGRNCAQRSPSSGALQHGSLNRCLIVGGVVGDIGFES